MAVRLTARGRRALRRGGRVRLTVVLRGVPGVRGATTRASLRVPRPR